ncbi:hypothetical protein KS4_18420 [Poriferisphaera corsica]|uniref:Uncharacterized protein n=1 Tax=Poriferisphaera corsica TaxID=2528020 RepID=A0A517YU67_9BACT|nr:hypothetical protein KS4_18420 [Poriferisphaera corsica]
MTPRDKIEQLLGIEDLRMSYGRVEFKYKGSHIGEGRKRNKPCECGSGKKYKKCCWNKKASE